MPTKGKRIEAAKVLDRGALPTFIAMGHRHLQKERPDGEGEEFTIPVDLLTVALPSDKQGLLDGIEEVRIGYKRKG